MSGIASRASTLRISICDYPKRDIIWPAVFSCEGFGFIKTAHLSRMHVWSGIFILTAAIGTLIHPSPCQVNQIVLRRIIFQFGRSTQLYPRYTRLPKNRRSPERIRRAFLPVTLEYHARESKACSIQANEALVLFAVLVISLLGRIFLR